MTKETKTTLKETSDAIPEISSEVEQEINYDLIATGPMYFDKRNLKPGYVPNFVSDLPGNIEAYKRIGYEVVIDQFKVGDDVASKSTKFGSAVTIQSKCGQLLVLMAIRQDLYDKYEAYKESKNKLRNQALGQIEGVDLKYQSLHGQHLGEYTVTKK